MAEVRTRWKGRPPLEEEGTVIPEAAAAAFRAAVTSVSMASVVFKKSRSIEAAFSDDET